MGRERLYRTEAVVLKRSDFGEADRLLTLYTPYRGKFRAIAKGIRRPISRKAGHLELFAHSHLLLAKGRSLDIITQAETIDTFPSLRSDLSRTSRAYYVIELLDRFTGEGIENHPLFELLLKVLGWLNSASDLDLVTRFYELHLLEHVGYRPQLFHCVSCDAAIEPVVNYFSPAEGGVVCPRCAEASPGIQSIAVNSLKVLRYLQTHPFDACERLQLGTEIQRDMENLMLRYMTCHLERNLKSVEFLRLLRQSDKSLRPDAVATVAPAEGEPTPT